MERQANQESFIVKPQSSLSTLGVLRETIKTIVKNGKPVGLILLLVFLTASQLEVATRCSLEFIQHERSGKDVCRTIGELLAVELLELVCVCNVFMVFAIATISSSYEAYTGKVLSLKKMFLKTYRSWKRPFITSCYMSLLILGLLLAYFVFKETISFMEGKPDITSSDQFYTIELIISWIAGGYLGALWMMSIVVSVLEDGINGLKVIDRAGELMKGKRIQASLIMMLYYITSAAVEEIFSELTTDFGKWARMAIEIPFVVGCICLLKLFMLVFFTVIYHEGKVTRKEEGILYMPFATDEA